MHGIFNLYAAKIKRFYLRNRLTDDEAADLLQETFIKVARSAKQYRRDARASTWIWAIAKNNLLDYWRKKKPTESLDELHDIGHDGPVELTSALIIWPDEVTNDLRNCVRRAFEEFAENNPHQAAALTLSVVEGWSMQELGSFLGRTVSATREYVSQCTRNG